MAGSRQNRTRRKMLFSGESDLFRRMILIFSIVFILVLVIIYLSLLSITQLQKNMVGVIRTQQVISGLDDLMFTVTEAETSQRGFILSRDSSFLVPYHNASPEIYRSMRGLKLLVSDNPEQLKRLTFLDSLIIQRRALLQTNLVVSNYSTADFLEGKREMDSIGKQIEDAKQKEFQLMQLRKSELEKSRRQTRATITIFSVMALALVVLPLLFTMLELRKRLELQQLLDSVFNSSLSGIQSFSSIRDANGTIIDFRFIQANAASLAMISESTDTVIGKTYSSVYAGHPYDDLMEQYKKVVETGVSYDGEYECSSKGISLWFYGTAVKLRDGFTLTLQDVTQSKKSAMERENNLKALQRSNAELEQFAYVASHDLQEPLRKILTFVDRLKIKEEEHLSEDGRNYMQRINNAAQRMRMLISDLLSFSRMSTVKYENKPVDLNELISEILNDLEVLIQQQCAVITYAELPSIEGMKVQLQQLFQNLIANSLKFAVEGRPPIIAIDGELISKTDKPEATHCRITFRDNGIGFDEKYQDKIFQIFQRLHGKSEYEGTGIGLAICKKIVENHKGIIVAHGTPGEGATFIITLPLKQKPIQNEPNT